MKKHKGRISLIIILLIYFGIFFTFLLGLLGSEDTKEPEVLLNDVKIKEELSSKISTFISEGRNNSKASSYYAMQFFIKDFKYDDTDKLRIALNASVESKRLASEDVGYYDESDVYVIDDSVVASKYKELFNEEITHDSILDGCPKFKYNKDASVYILIRTCGTGDGMPVILYNKEKYVVDNDDIIAYVNVGAYLNGSVYRGYDAENIIFHDIEINLGDEEDIVRKISKYKNRFMKYKFYFSKNNDGTYYLKKITKWYEVDIQH